MLVDKLWMVIIFLTAFSLWSKAQTFEEVYKKVKSDSFSENPKSSEILDSAISLCPDITKYPDLLFQKGKVTYNKDYLDLAIPYLKKSLDFTPKDSLYLIMEIQKYLSYAYYELDELETSNLHAKQALRFAQDLEDSLAINALQLDILTINYELDYPNALADLRDFIEHSDLKKDTCSYFMGKMDLVNYLYDEENIAELKKEMAYFDNHPIPDNCDIATLYHLLMSAQVASIENQELKSNDFLNSIHSNYSDDYLYVRDKKIIYETYVNNYKKLGSKDSVVKYNNLLNELIINDKNESQKRALEKQQENQNLEKLNQQLIYNKRKQIWASVALALIIILIGAYFIVRYRKKKKKLESIQVKLKNQQKKWKKNYFQIWKNNKQNQQELIQIKQQLPKENKEENIELTQNLQNEKIKLHYNLNSQENEIYHKIETEFPFLNETEKLVCYFKELNLTHKEIAKILNRSVKSIDSYQYRISQKVHKNNDYKSE